MNAPAVSVAALALSALALAATFVDFSPTVSEGGPALPDADAIDGELAERLSARIEVLSETQRALADQLAMLEVQVTSAPRTPATKRLVSQTELEALRDELRAALAGGTMPKLLGDEAPSPEFTEHVEESMRSIRLKEAREDAQRAVASRSERLREKLPDVAQRLGLTAQQESSLEASLVTLYEQRANYGVLWESGEVDEKGEFRELDQANMNGFLTSLSTSLTPQQLQDYLALQGDLFPGGADGGGK